MAPGPPNLGENRFGILLSPPKKKRNRPGPEYPDLAPVLTTTMTTENPKYIVLSACEGEKKLTAYSCFGIYNSIQAIDKGIISVTTLRDGNLLLLVKSQQVANKFLKRNDLPGVCKISASLHGSLNFVKGTIYAPYLNDIPEDEIVRELAVHKVVAAHKFTKIIEGVSKPTGVVLLTFDCYYLPQKINVAWNMVKIKEYIPNPMRCKTCQRLGHTAKYCNNGAACVTCSLPPHLPERACTQVLCTNCNGEHEASSRECPKYLELKELLKIKINNKCTMREAKNILKTTTNSNTTTSYAAVAAATNINNNKNSTLNKNLSNNNSTSTANSQKKETKNSTSIINNTTTNNFTHTVNNADSITAQYANKKQIPKLPAANPATTNNKKKTSTDFETTSHSDISEQCIPNEPCQNNPLFIPLKSLNNVLNKSQLSLYNSTDSDN